MTGSSVDMGNPTLMQSIFIMEGHTCPSCSQSLIKVLRCHPLIINDLIDVTWLGKVTVSHFKELLSDSIISIAQTAGIQLQFQVSQPLIMRSNLSEQDHISILKRSNPWHQVTTKLSPSSQSSSPEITVNPAANLQLFIEELKCSVGAQQLEFQLSQLPGILNVKMMIVTQQGHIQYNPYEIDARTIKDSITSYGYQSKVIDSSTLPKPRAISYLSLICSLVMGILQSVYYYGHSREVLDSTLLVNHHLSIIMLLKFIIAMTTIVINILPLFINTTKFIIRTRSLNSDCLVSLGVLLHVIVCSILTFHPHPNYNSVPWEDTVYFISLFLILQYCELSGKRLALVGLQKLTSNIPQFTTLITKQLNGNRELMLETSLIKVDDIVKVIPNTRFPGDGEIIRGTTTVDETILTGKSTKCPVKSEGDDVIGGTLNVNNMVWVKIRRIGEHSTLHQVVDLVQVAQEKRSKLQISVARVTSLVIPSIIITAIITCLGWIILSIQVNLPWSVNPVTGMFMGISLLVIINPCGLGLAIPIPIMVACGIGAESGLLVRGGDATLGAASRVNVVVFDKTGTLTRGRPVITDVVMKHSKITTSTDKNDWQGEIMLWEAIILLETKSSHPLARAIISYGNTLLSLSNQSELTSSINLTDFEDVIGLGVRATIDFGTSVKLMGNKAQQFQLVIGSWKWLQVNNMINKTEFDLNMEFNLKSWGDRGKATCLIGLAPINMVGNVIGGLAAADTIRPESQALVKELQTRGMEVWMLTGDATHAAKETAQQLGIVNVIPEVLPHQKADRVRWLQTRQGEHLLPRSKLEWLLSNFQPHPPNRSIVAMVGDGINDSLALAQADLGIALGNGHDLAINQASVIMLTNNLTSILSLLDLSQSTINTIRRNVAFISIYSLLALPLIGGLSLPLFSTIIPLPIAGLLQGLATLIIIISSLIPIWTYHPTTHLPNPNQPYTTYTPPTKSIRSPFTLSIGNLLMSPNPTYKK